MKRFRWTLLFVTVSILSFVGWRRGSVVLAVEWRDVIAARLDEGDIDVALDLDPLNIPEGSDVRRRGLLAGPAVFAVDDHSANVWAAFDRCDEAVVVVRRREPPHTSTRFPMPIEAGYRLFGIARIGGLEPDTSYDYEVIADGYRSGRFEGSFRTAPLPTTKGRFDIVVSSCMDALADDVQPLWYCALAESPAFHLLLGDNTYANTSDPREHWICHMRQRRIPSFAAMLRSVPTFAAWDDHDYGENDSDGTSPGKEDALLAFRQLFPNPPTPVAGNEGVYFSFNWGDVEFFMLDVRYHRSPDGARDDDAKTMLGERQFQWLRSRLAASKATFKVIASPSSLDDNSSDSWRLYGRERERLFRDIRRAGIPGVIWLSGDTHFSALRTWPADEALDYPLHEIISSGIGQKERGHPLEQHPSDSKPWPPIEPMPLYRQAFAVLTFDTTDTDPSVRVRIIREGAVTALDRTIRRSTLEAASR